MKARIFLAALVVGLAACDGGNTGLELRGNVAVSFATRTPSGSGAPARAIQASAVTALDDTLVVGTDTLIVTRAQIVLRNIELEPVETAACGSGQGPSTCEEIELGPVLVDLPLVPGVVRRFAVDVPPGAYDEIEFEIHKVSGDDPEDAAFRQAHPEFVDKSIRVEGTFRGQAFVFETDLNVAQELDLTPPLNVLQLSGTNITIRVGLAEWFRAPSGALIDPATGNRGGENEGLVKENIKESIEAFEDENEDGGRGD